MWLVFVSAGLNVVLDPFFVLGWGPFPRWGRGAAIATFLSRGLATFAGIAILLDGRFGVRLRIGDLAPDVALLKRLVGIGYPATFDGWARSFAAVAMAGFVARFGPAPTAAFGIGVRLMSVTWAVAGAVGQATATGVGQNLGAETPPDRAVAVARTATAATMVFIFAVAAVLFAFPAAAIDQGLRRGPGRDRRGCDLPSDHRPLLGTLRRRDGHSGRVPRGREHPRGDGPLDPLAVDLQIPAGHWPRVRLDRDDPRTNLAISGLGWGVEGIWLALVAGMVGSFVVAVGWFRIGTWTEGVIDEIESASGSESPRDEPTTVDESEPRIRRRLSRRDRRS